MHQRNGKGTKCLNFMKSTVTTFPLCFVQKYSKIYIFFKKKQKMRSGFIKMSHRLLKLYQKEVNKRFVHEVTLKCVFPCCQDGYRPESRSVPGLVEHFTGAQCSVRTDFCCSWKQAFVKWETAHCLALSPDPYPHEQVVCEEVHVYPMHQTKIQNTFTTVHKRIASDSTSCGVGAEVSSHRRAL